MLVLSRRVDEKVVFSGGGVSGTIKVLRIANGKVRLGFEFSESVIISRSELCKEDKGGAESEVKRDRCDQPTV